MIQSDLELKCTQERIAYFEGLVAQFRVSVQPENFAAMAGGYLAEIEKMHAEVIAYLSHHLSEAQPTEVMTYIERGPGTKGIAANVFSPALPVEGLESELQPAAGRVEEQSEGVATASVAVGSISGELQHGRETNEVIAMSDWKARKRAKALAAKMSPTKPEPKTAAAMLA